MVNRKKRLKKGLESLQKQIEMHKKKLQEAEKQGKIELFDYYKKEIEVKKKDKEKKEKLLKK